MKKHADLSSEDSKQLCKDIKSSKDETSMYSEKLKDPHSDGLDELHKPLTVGVDKMKLKNTLLINSHEYKQKLELGKAIHEIIKNHEVYLIKVKNDPKIKSKSNVGIENKIDAGRTISSGRMCSRN